MATSACAGPCVRTTCPWTGSGTAIAFVSRGRPRPRLTASSLVRGDAMCVVRERRQPPCKTWRRSCRGHPERLVGAQELSPSPGSAEHGRFGSKRRGTIPTRASAVAARDLASTAQRPSRAIGGRSRSFRQALERQDAAASDRSDAVRFLRERLRSLRRTWRRPLRGHHPGQCSAERRCGFSSRTAKRGDADGATETASRRHARALRRIQN